jgi:hypothetical protein
MEGTGMTYSKEDVRFHSDYGRTSHPAVNVKVPWVQDYDALARKVAEDNGYIGREVEMFVEFFDAYRDRADMDGSDWTWDAAIEQAWEQLQEDAREYVWHDRNVKVYSEGRSGGWAIVEGIPDFDSWDAIELGRWHRFERIARAYADDVPYSQLTLLCINDFEQHMRELPSAASVVLAGSGVGTVRFIEAGTIEGVMYVDVLDDDGNVMDYNVPLSEARIGYGGWPVTTMEQEAER